MNYQRLRVADICEQAEQLQRIDEALAGFKTSTNAERDQRARAGREVLLRSLVVLACRQPRIVHPLHIGMTGEELSHRERVFRMTFQAEMQRFRALQQQEGVKRRQAGSGVSQSLYSRFDDEGEIAERLGVGDAVVGGIRLDKVGEASRGLPIELAAVYDNPADGITVTADELGSGIDDDVSTPLDGTAEGRRRGSVVDDQRHSFLVRDLRQLLNVNDVELWIADSLGIDRLCFVVDGGAQPGEIVGIHKLHFDAELGERVVK